MLRHIIKYQNNYISANLFKGNLIKLLNKSICLRALLCSDIFTYKIEFEAWPSSHTDNKTIIKPYNGSIFEVRNYYNEVFPGLGSIGSACSSKRGAI